MQERDTIEKKIPVGILRKLRYKETNKKITVDVKESCDEKTQTKSCDKETLTRKITINVNRKFWWKNKT